MNVHEPLEPAAKGVPYFRAVEGPDGQWWWAECPRCGEIVLNDDGQGPARHWPVADGCPECGRDIDLFGGNPDCPVCAAEPAVAL